MLREKARARAVAARRALDGTADDSGISTTRVSGTASLPPNAKPRDLTHVRPEHPHWPLVVMTVLTQLSVGAFATVWLLQLLGAAPGLGVTVREEAVKKYRLC